MRNEQNWNWLVQNWCHTYQLLRCSSRQIDPWKSGVSVGPFLWNLIEFAQVSTQKNLSSIQAPLLQALTAFSSDLFVLVSASKPTVNKFLRLSSGGNKYGGINVLLSIGDAVIYLQIIILFSHHCINCKLAILIGRLFQLKKIINQHWQPYQITNNLTFGSCFSVSCT